MITRIEIDGFKTFRNFSLDFAPLTIIAGLNASGKSNLFDALHLLSRLADTDLRTAFKEQRGEASELFTMYNDGQFSNEMRFSVEMLLNKYVSDNWGGETTIKYTRLRYTLKLARVERQRGIQDIVVLEEELVNLKHQNDPWVNAHLPQETLETWRPKVERGRRGKPYISTEITSSGAVTIKIPQDGKPGGKETPANVVSSTVLSSVNSIDFPHVFAAKQEMLSWKFLQLSPDELRKPSPYLAPDQIAENGGNLAAVLSRIGKEDSYKLKEISRRLNRLLPDLSRVSVRDDQSGKQFVIEVKSVDGRIFTSRVLSEGTLRLLVLCVLLYDNEHNGLICFEEPENGVHPARLKEMVGLLHDLSVNFKDPQSSLRQVIVNTHSPVLLGEMFSFNDSSNVAVWFSKLVTETFMRSESIKELLKVTKMLPVNTSPQVQMEGFTDKIALHEAQTFLSSLPDADKLIGLL